MNGQCKNPDGNPIVVEDSEILGIFESIFQ